jgi:hypothetical protein
MPNSTQVLIPCLAQSAPAVELADEADHGPTFHHITEPPPVIRMSMVCKAHSMHLWSHELLDHISKAGMHDANKAKLTRSCGKQLSMYAASMTHTSRAAMSPAPPVKQLKFAYARNPPTAHFSRRRGPMASSCRGPTPKQPWGQSAGLRMILFPMHEGGHAPQGRCPCMSAWGSSIPNLSLVAPVQGVARSSVYSALRTAVAAAADRL